MTTDPLTPSPWSTPAMVAGFASSAPNAVLMRFAEAELRGLEHGALLDIGCGAGRNALPLAAQGWDVVGVDLSSPMLAAAVRRSREGGSSGRALFSHAAMDALPARDASVNLVIAHGIWNLAGSSAQFRLAVREAARVARPGAALFVFTFSRHTLPAGVAPVAGETFVFTQFSGQPQIFLTGDELVSEMRDAGFDADAAVPLTEYNRRALGALHVGSSPVIYEAAFRKRG